MIKILTVIGARPQIIKAAALSRAVRERFSGRVREKILHTGQHYDEAMSAVFFKELGIPQPHFNLGVGSSGQGIQTAKMIEGIEKVLQAERFHGVVLYGDTNSTLAGAIAASKLHVPVFHIEAGLRSYNLAMPEEVNRIVCDHLSSIMFAPTATAVNNLKKEGLDSPAMRFADGKSRLVINSGDIMYDNSLYFGAVAAQRSNVLERLGLEGERYVLATVHRDFNTDNPLRLESIFSALLNIAEERNIKVVIPLHPRTRKMLSDSSGNSLGEKLMASERLVVVPPVPFLDMIVLEKNAALVMTDSGGVQKEAFFYQKPCVILRPETEWVEIIEHGAGIIADADFDRIIAACDSLLGKEVSFPHLFGDGNAAEKILEEIIQYLS